MFPINNIYQDKANSHLDPTDKICQDMVVISNCQSLTWKSSFAIQDLHIVQLSWRDFFSIGICFAVGV